MRTATLLLALFGIVGEPLLAQLKGTVRLQAGPFLPITVETGGAPGSDVIAEVELTFPPELIRAQAANGSIQPQFRVVETDVEGTQLDAEVPFQFDLGHGRRKGTLLILVKADSLRNNVRNYRVYSTAEPVNIAPLVKLEDIGDYEGQETWKIITPSATYFYHHQSGGFASLIDREGKDWISYHPGNRDKGEFRGIPNIAPPGFHPGQPNGKKPGKIIFSGPIRVRLLAETEDDNWGTYWDIFPTYARMTLFKKGPEPYWILYEGTPGGEFTVSDYWVNSAGTRFDSEPYVNKNAWHGDLPKPEWVYFADAALQRVLFLARHEYSPVIDEYWHFGDGGMTVFGFGRGPRAEGWQRLTDVPSHLTIGFVESTNHQDIAGIIQSTTQQLNVQVGPVRTQ